MKNRFVVFFALGCLLCLAVAYQPKLADARPHLPDLPNLPDVNAPNPNVPDPNAPDPGAPDTSMLPGESYEAWAKRVHPEISLQGYETAKQARYDPNDPYPQDWDIDGLPDNHPKDRIYGVDLPDPDPDPDPEPVPAAEETTQARATSVEETTEGTTEGTTEEATNTRDSANTSKEDGPGALSWLIILVTVGLIYRSLRRGNGER